MSLSTKCRQTHFAFIVEEDSRLGLPKLRLLTFQSEYADRSHFHRYIYLVDVRRAERLENAGSGVKSRPPFVYHK